MKLTRLIRSNLAKFKTWHGFTMIELVVVVSITTMLAAFVIVYQNSSRDQVKLAVEASKIAQMVGQAKSLAISTYNAQPGLCGYYIHFTNTSYEMYSFTNAAGCTTLSSPPSGAFIRRFDLERGLRLVSGVPVPVTDIIFVPPEPKVYLNIGGSLYENSIGNIYLSASGSSTKTLKVYPSGQVSF